MEHVNEMWTAHVVMWERAEQIAMVVFKRRRGQISE